MALLEARNVSKVFGGLVAVGVRVNLQPFAQRLCVAVAHGLRRRVPEPVGRAVEDLT